LFIILFHREEKKRKLEEKKLEQEKKEKEAERKKQQKKRQKARENRPEQRARFVGSLVKNEGDGTPGTVKLDKAALLVPKEISQFFHGHISR